MRNTAQLAQKGGTLSRFFSSRLVLTILASGCILLLGFVLGTLNVAYSVVIAGFFIMLMIFLLKLDELTVVLIVAVHIFIDSYLAFDVYQVALLLMLTFFAIRYFGRSTDRLWSTPRATALWFSFLLLNIYATIEGGDFNLRNAFSFYLNIILSPFLLYWLGNMVAKDISSLRHAFRWIAILATFMAVHTIIEATTGQFLFEVTRSGAAASANSTFQIPGSSLLRADSFLGNPDANGLMLSTSFALPLGLFLESRQLWKKIIYLLEALLILLALLFTYSTGAWTAVGIGMLIFLFLTGKKRYAVLLLVVVLLVIGISFVLLPSHIEAFLSHSSSDGHLSLHMADWQTALRVIEAYPLFGVGLGNQAYLIRAEPYRVPEQYIPLAEPDNSFVQWGATSGIPTMLVFVALLIVVIWYAWRNWQAIDVCYRPLVAGGMIALIVLSVGSLSTDGWTDSAAMGYLGWLIAGLVSSTFIGRDLKRQQLDAVALTNFPASQSRAFGTTLDSIEMAETVQVTSVSPEASQKGRTE
ncbi:MAG: O-antigen ligase family protein [Chloroflexi bacterium]|nr:MAG: O-antigen ligase family protein [Chloroflexota bacterium]